MNQAVATTKDNSLRALVARPQYSERFKQVLGERAPQFVSSLIAVGSSMPNVEPNSIIAAAMTAAALDLPIDKNLGFAHIVPYAGVAQFQMGYKGYVQLGLRTGQYRHLNTAEVYEGQLVKYDPLKGELILDPDKKKSETVVGYAAYLALINGFEHALYWPTEKIKTHAERYSQAYKRKKMDSPWFTNFDVMAKKTVLKALISQWGPMSVQMQRAVVEDQGIRRGIDADIEYPDNSPMVQAPEGLETEAEVVPAEAPPALFPAGEGKPAAKPKKPAAPAPDSKVTELRKLIAEAKLTEAAIVKVMHDAGVDETLTTLDDIHKINPKAVEHFVANFEESKPKA